MNSTPVLPLLPSPILVDTPVVGHPLADRPPAVLDDVLVPVAAIAPTRKFLYFFGLLELVDEGVNLLDG